MTAFNSKWKHEKLAVRLIVRFREGLLNTLVQPLFCSLNLLFGGAH